MKFKWWHATVAGGLFGLLLGYGIETLRQLRFEYIVRRMAEDFQSRGESPPLIIDFLRPEAIPFLSCLLCSVVSSVVYVIWSRRD